MAARRVSAPPSERSTIIARVNSVRTESVPQRADSLTTWLRRKDPPRTYCARGSGTGCCSRPVRRRPRKAPRGGTPGTHARCTGRARPEAQRPSSRRQTSRFTAAGTCRDPRRRCVARGGVTWARLLLLELSIKAESARSNPPRHRRSERVRSSSCAYRNFSCISRDAVNWIL